MYSWFKPFFSCLSCLFLLFLLGSKPVHAATTTVCGSGCDYTSLNDAITAIPAPGDTILLSSGYTFGSPPENPSLNLPDDLTLTCDPGVVYGDAGAASMYLYPGSNNTIRDCTFENTSFDASGKVNVSWIDNTFSPAASSQIVLTGTTGFTITGNQGIQKIQNQNADDGTISNNQFECRHGQNCIALVTAGGGPFDYQNPADVPNDIDITNNVFSNYNTSTGGDFVYLYAGININFASNTIRSVVQVDDSFITMLSIGNAQVTLNSNKFFFPEKRSGETSGTWGLNIRVDSSDTTVSAEHNAFFITSSTQSATNGSACLGVFDNGATPGTKNINLTFRYNLCFNGTSSTGGTGMAFNYYTTSSIITLTENYNGFYNLSQSLNDDTGTITTTSTTDIVSDPVMRRENIDTSDDFTPVPMSRYLDVDGTQDIGPYDLARTASYTIDDNCTVDYTTCMSQYPSIVNRVARSGDSIHIAAGTYPGLALNGPLSNINLSGDGTTTIFDGALQFNNSFKLTDITSSTFADLSLVNSTDTTVSSYTITKTILNFGGNDYTDSSAFGAPANSVFFITNGICDAEVIQTDGADITSVLTGSNAVNVFLLDAGPAHVTALAPNNVIDDIPTFAATCGITPSLAIQDVFTPNGDGSYTFNQAALTGASVSLATGMTNPASITQNIARGYRSGLQLDSATSNTFSNISFSQNDLGVTFLASSTGNVITSSTFSNNANADIVSSATGTNDLVNTLFNRANSDIDRGSVRVFFNAVIRVLDSILSPLSGITVTFTSSNGLTNTSSTTNGTGYTNTLLSQVYTMTTSSIALTSGGYNPFTISASASGTYSATSSQILIQNGTSTYQLIMLLNTGNSGNSSGGGAGSLTSILSNGSYSPITTLSTTPILPSNPRIHQLIKLPDDGNEKTQHDSTVYYIGADGKRHAFPNSSVYFSWYCNFSQVITVSAEELANFALGQNVTYKPSELVKFRGTNTVYIVQTQHQLRAIPTETLAIQLFGKNWNTLVHDIDDTLYLDYRLGDALESSISKQALMQQIHYPSAEMNIAGYQDMPIQDAPSATCSKDTQQPTATQRTTTPDKQQKSWPFKNIPKNFSFQENLNQNSPASIEIRYLQEFLVWKGKDIYSDGRVTGNFGTRTSEAVKKYQQTQNLLQTGALGPGTRTAINTELASLK
jgi:hypothetical protein